MKASQDIVHESQTKTAVRQLSQGRHAAACRTGDRLSQTEPCNPRTTYLGSFFLFFPLIR